MTITFTPSTSGVTLDETGGLQFNGSAGNTVPATDNDDSDVSLATLLAQRALLNTELFTTLGLSSAFSSTNGLAHGTIGTVTSTTPITGIKFAYTNGTSSGLFAVDGKELFLYSTAVDPDVVLLRKADGSGNPDPNGAIVAAIDLEVDVDGTSTSEGVNVWMVQFGALKNSNTTNPDDTLPLANLSLTVDALLKFDFAGAPSGQNYFMLFGKQNAALLVSGGNPVDDTTNTNISTGDTVNTSQGGGATTLGVNNQMVDPGEGMHFRFVTLANTNYLVPNLDQNEADVEANTIANGFIDTTGASVQFVQTQPGGGAGQYFTVKLTAYEADKSAALETGTHFGEELDNDTKVNIQAADVKVIRGGVNVAGTDPPGSAPPVTVSVVGGVLTVSGLKAGDELFYKTLTVHNHVFVQAVSGAAFDIGGFTLLSAEQTPFAINNIKFDDDGPSITLSAAGQVTHDESPGLQTLADGNQSTATEDDNDDDVTAASLPSELATRLGPGGLNLSGQLGQAISGAVVVNAVGGVDGVAHLNLTVKLAGASGLSAVNGGAITLANDKVVDPVNGLDNLVIGKDTQNNVVVAIYLGQDGKISVVQYEALVHPSSGNGSGGAHDEQIDINDGVLFAVVTDGDGDKAEVDVGDRVNFEDAGPTIATTGTEPTATVDETVLATNATADFSGNFTSSFGPDGAGSLVYALGVSSPGADSGLVDTATNHSVFLFLESGAVVGREGTTSSTAASGSIVFTVTLNSATGVITLDQQRAIVHANPADPDDSKTLSDDTLITLTATKTDGDGDTAAATLNIAQNLIFKDDGPSIATTGNEPSATVDETVLATNATADFSVNFTSSFGADGAGTLTYALGVSAPGGVDSGLVDTATNHSVFLFLESGAVVGREGTSAAGAVGGNIVFVASINSTSGVVTLDQQRAIVHPNPANPDDSKTLAADTLITLTATKTDKDGDSATAMLNIAQNLIFKDDGPSAAMTLGTAEVTIDESADLQTLADGNQSTASEDDNDNDVLGTTAFLGSTLATVFGAVSTPGSDGASFPQYALSPAAVVASIGSSGGADGTKSTVFALAINGGNGTDSVLDTTDAKSVFLYKEGDLVVGRFNADNNAGTGTSGNEAAAFALAIDSGGKVAIVQYVSLGHPNANNPDDAIDLTGKINALVTVTDNDDDTATSTPLAIGQLINFEDDGPTITAPFDADPGTAGIQTPEKLGNAVGQSASGAFGYDIGADDHLAAFYAAGGSDFVDTNGALAGVQINLTGTVDNAQNPNITNSEVTLASESLTSASFNFSFHYDKDPLTAGVQDATAGGTLVFNKAADTYTFTLNDVIDGFSFDVLHTAELIAKQPTGNTGHPQIVAEQLTPNGDPNPFFVQFTANSTTQQIGFGFNSTGDGAPNGPPTDVSFTQGAHDMVTNTNEDWVSATQDTNGVAGDTIQKGELLTLRFFQENILSDVDPNAPGGGTERLDPTTSASGVVIKFDGIGNSEDLVVILDLKDAVGNEVTRAVNVENSDLIKGANVPVPYNAEFTLDNNDALLILEQNDYTVAGETYQIQGIQIMQSANGLTGNAINLNGATGANGGSNATSNLTAWDPTDNDVLKIVDIGFVQKTDATIDANLDFSFTLADADFDPTATQHMLVNVSNGWIV